MSDAEKRCTDKDIQQYYIDGLTGNHAYHNYAPKAAGFNDQSQPCGPRSAQELIRRQIAEARNGNERA